MYYYQLRATVLDMCYSTDPVALADSSNSDLTGEFNFNRNNFASRMITRNQRAGTECLQQKAAAAVLDTAGGFSKILYPCSERGGARAGMR